MRDAQIARAVRAEANLANTGGDAPPRAYTATIEDCRAAIEDAVALWADATGIKDEWVEDQVHRLHGELYR